MGYIIEDPIDGSAAYQIDGGLSGGGSDSPQSVLPFPSMTFTPVIGMLLAPTLKQLGARLMVDASGQLVGVGFFQQYAVAGPAPDARVAVLIAGLLAILSSTRGSMDKQYPRRVPLALVKYSDAARAQGNYDSKMIRATRPGGTFNKTSPVLYLALANDPVVRAAMGGLVGCPPNIGEQIDLANFYQLSDDGVPPYFPERAQGYVYFEITRDGVYDVVANFNSNGVTEITIPEKSLLPAYLFFNDPPPSLPRLYIGEWAPAIDNVLLCR